MRVFIGLADVAGYASGLEAGMREIGVPVRRVDLTGDPLRFHRGHESPGFRTGLRDRVLRALVSIVPRWARRPVRSIIALGWFVVALARADAVILLGGDSFLPGGLDLAILRRLGRRIIIVFTGSDHRPPWLNGKWVRQLGARGPAWLARETATVAARVRRAERYADVIVALPASSQFHRRPAVSFLAVGVPLRAIGDRQGSAGRAAPPAAEPSRGDRPVTVLHCPTDPVGKGTDLVRAAVDTTRRSGRSVEYRERSGVPHAEILAELGRADLVVDEAFSDTPMGVLAAEAAWFGCPTLVAGPDAPAILARIAGPDRPPTRYVETGDLADALAALVDDPDGRRTLGDAAKDFVRSRWTAAVVAERYMDLLRAADDPWGRFDPMTETELSAWGLSTEARDAAIDVLVAAHGFSALGLPTGSAAAAAARVLADA